VIEVITEREKVKGGDNRKRKEMRRSGSLNLIQGGIKNAFENI